MNQATELLIEIIETNEDLSLTVESCLSAAECCENPHGSLTKWLEEWVSDTLANSQSQIAIYLPGIDFEILAWYFLDDEFLEEN